jgi:hypothetical protein
MNKKARLFLALACIGLVVNMLRFVSSVAVPANVCDFALGFGVAMLVGTMLNWSGRRF